MIITLRSTVRIAPHILPYFHFLAEKMFYSFAADALRLSPPPCPRVFRVLFPSRRQLERDQRVMRFVQNQEGKRHGIRQTFHSRSSFFSPQSKTISTADVWIPIFSFFPAGPGIVEFRTPSLSLVREIEILTRLIAQGRRMKSRDRSSLCAFFGWVPDCLFNAHFPIPPPPPFHRAFLGRIFTTPYSSRLDFRKLQRFPCAFTAAAMAGPWN